MTFETILVTGGAGFIGANFVRDVLAHDSCRIVVVDKLTYAGSLLNLRDVESDDRFEFVKADIADRPAMEELFSKWQPDAVVNLAAESHVDRSIDAPGVFVQTNVVGTFVLLDVARRHVAELGAAKAGKFRFLHVSTDEVYGTLGETGEFSETTPYAPNSPYAASKAAGDHFVRAYHETFGLPTLITNCSNNYGPFQFPEKLIPLMVLNAIDGKDLPIYGDGKNVRDWLYVEDHSSGIRRALAAGVPGRKYNIGGGNERTNIEIVDKICDLLEEHLPAASNARLAERGKSGYRDLKVFVPDRPGHDRRYAIDASRIRRELGWEPHSNFDAGMAKTVRWYIENREWCDSVLAGQYDRERLGLGEDL